MSAKRAVVKCKMCRHLYRPLRVVKCNFDDDDDDDNHQSMKMSDSDLKVNRNIYLDAVTCDRMRLIGPWSGQSGPIIYLDLDIYLDIYFALP